MKYRQLMPKEIVGAIEKAIEHGYRSVTTISTDRLQELRKKVEVMVSVRPRYIEHFQDRFNQMLFISVPASGRVCSIDIYDGGEIVVNISNKNLKEVALLLDNDVELKE